MKSFIFYANRFKSRVKGHRATVHNTIVQWLEQHCSSQGHCTQHHRAVAGAALLITRPLHTTPFCSGRYSTAHQSSQPHRVTAHNTIVQWLIQHCWSVITASQGHRTQHHCAVANTALLISHHSLTGSLHTTPLCSGGCGSTAHHRAITHNTTVQWRLVQNCSSRGHCTQHHCVVAAGAPLLMTGPLHTTPLCSGRWCTTTHHRASAHNTTSTCSGRCSIVHHRATAQNTIVQCRCSTAHQSSQPHRAIAHNITVQWRLVQHCSSQDHYTQPYCAVAASAALLIATAHTTMQWLMLQHCSSQGHCTRQPCAVPSSNINWHAPELN